MSGLNFKPPTEEFWNESIIAYTTLLAGWDPDSEQWCEACWTSIDPLACRVLSDLVAQNRIKLREDALIKGLERYIGADLFVDSGPVLRRLNFGVYRDHWFIETLVPFIDSIPNVVEEFWDTISELKRTALTKFRENEVIPTVTVEQKRLMQSGRSIQYRMIRNFVLRRQQPDRESDDIGNLSSEVPISEPYDRALPKLRELFRLYYRILQQLYRPAYQKEHRWRKRWDHRGG